METDGAVGEPVELGEIVNEQGFGFGGGLIDTANQFAALRTN